MNNVDGQVKGVVLLCVKRSAFVVILPSKTCFWINIIVQKHRPNPSHNLYLKSGVNDNKTKQIKIVDTPKPVHVL